MRATVTTLLITRPSPSAEMNAGHTCTKVDPAAAAVPSLVTHCGWVATGMHVFDLHASRDSCSYCAWM